MKRAPRTNPLGVDQARPSSQKSSVFAGSGTPAMAARAESHHGPMRLRSNGSTSSARPTLPPGSSG
jgi:hypothetical protein